MSVAIFRTIAIATPALLVMAGVAVWMNNRVPAHLAVYSHDRVDRPARPSEVERAATRKICGSVLGLQDFTTRGQTRIGPAIDSRNPAAGPGKYCECLVGQIEDRASRLQMLVFVEQLHANLSSTDWLSFNGSDRTAAIAKRSGMDASTYKREVNATADIVVEFADDCRLKRAGLR